MAILLPQPLENQAVLQVDKAAPENPGFWGETKTVKSTDLDCRLHIRAGCHPEKEQLFALYQ
ncbi:MAG: hypothetical protein IPM82_24505 [Saprospiraceae bacterium]|nr:hypothetical protein [Saprospiraceae bacterium]